MTVVEFDHFLTEINCCFFVFLISPHTAKSVVENDKTRIKLLDKVVEDLCATSTVIASLVYDQLKFFLLLASSLLSAGPSNLKS